MKHNYSYTIAIVLIIGLVIGACSKDDRDPRLFVHVQEEDGTAANAATVELGTVQLPDSPEAH